MGDEARKEGQQTPGETKAVELSDQDLEKVAGGFLGFFLNPPTKPTISKGKTGIEGESVEDRHRGSIE